MTITTTANIRRLYLPALTIALVSTLRANDPPSPVEPPRADNCGDAIIDVISDCGGSGWGDRCSDSIREFYKECWDVGSGTADPKSSSSQAEPD